MTGSEGEDGLRNRIAKVQCPNCDKMVHAYRTKKGRMFLTTGGAILLGGAGAVVGTGIGIATAGWGAPATKFLGAGGAALGGGAGYIAGDNVDKPQCPNCEETIKLGI